MDGVMGWGAGDWQGARAIAPEPRAVAACIVPPLARDAARGAAVVGRQTGWRCAVPRPVWSLREQGTPRRVCAVSGRPALQCRGCDTRAAVCRPRVLPSVVLPSARLWIAGLDRGRVYACPF